MQKFENLSLLNAGKIREIYDLGNSLLFYVSDKISAYDVVMNELIPGKGRVLNLFSKFWFENTKHIIANHFISDNPDDYPSECQEVIKNYNKNYDENLDGSTVLVKKCKPLAVEFVVRGYVAGSGWKEYQQTGKICGVSLPTGLLNYSKLDEPIFTPASKAEQGFHDENIDFEKTCEILGKETAEKLKNISIELFKFGTAKLAKLGIILADTKFEFGIDENGELMLIDEVMTPDSSRFWKVSSYKASSYKVGESPENYDKQILRDYLETLDWDKNPPAPKLPQSILDKTISKYQELYKLLKTN